MKIQQELILNAKERYTTPVQIPPFCFNGPTEGLETPVWSPPYNLVITNIAVIGAEFETPPGGYTVAALRKWNDLTPYDEPIEIQEMSLASNRKNTSINLLSSFTKDLSVTPYDSLYCVIVSGNAHAHLTVQVYANRNDGVR